MTSETRQTPVCEIRFGISGLRHPSLQGNFYPSDLPEDWRLDYYSNEFRLILLNPDDLGLLAPLNEVLENQDLDERCAVVINELCDDIDGEDFVVFLDVPEASEDNFKNIIARQCDEGSSIFLIDLHTLLKTRHPEESCFSIPLSWQKCQSDRGDSLFYYISEPQTIAPQELKKIIEQIREQAKLEQVDEVNVVFSSSDNALENCRNANLLESMM